MRHFISMLYLKGNFRMKAITVTILITLFFSIALLAENQYVSEHEKTLNEIQNIKDYLDWNQFVIGGFCTVISLLLVVIGWFTRNIIFEMKASNVKQDEQINDLKKLYEIESKKLALLEQRIALTLK